MSSLKFATVVIPLQNPSTGKEIEKFSQQCDDSFDIVPQKVRSTKKNKTQKNAQKAAKKQEKLLQRSLNQQYVREIKSDYMTW